MTGATTDSIGNDANRDDDDDDECVDDDVAVVVDIDCWLAAIYKSKNQ